MASFNPDIIGFPSSGNTARVNSIICNAPKGATNQYANVSYFGDSHIQPTGVGLYNKLNNRFPHGEVVSIGQ